MYDLSGLSRNPLPALVNDFKLGYIGFRVVLGCAMLEGCASRLGIVFLEPAF